MGGAGSILVIVIFSASGTFYAFIKYQLNE